MFSIVFLATIARQQEVMDMIVDERSFTAAVAKIELYLETPPREGTPQDAEFSALLEDVAQYETVLHSQPIRSSLETTIDRAHDLMRAAADLRRKREAVTRPRWSSFPEDGQGVGPTTGI
jgi:hypothetical protein